MAGHEALGREYLLHEEIGRGAMAVVRRATSRHGGPPLAAKLLRPELAGDRRIRELFLREEAALRALDHPSIVGLRDLIVEGGTLALVMEYVDGPNLRHYLSFRGGRLTPPEVVAVAAQTANALAVAHEHGVVHLDLKPENLLVLRGSAPPDIRITDFGVAVLLNDADHGAAGGTPGYTAPEIFQGGPPTPAADVWSLGVLLLELATGRPTGDPTALPGPLGPVARDCLATDPRRRPPARRVAAYLQQFAAGQAGVRPPSSPPLNAGPFGSPALGSPQPGSPAFGAPPAGSRPFGSPPVSGQPASGFTPGDEFEPTTLSLGFPPPQLPQPSFPPPAPPQPPRAAFLGPHQTPGQFPGQTPGQLPGQTPGQVRGQLSGHRPGDQAGQTPGHRDTIGSWAERLPATAVHQPGTGPHQPGAGAYPSGRAPYQPVSVPPAREKSRWRRGPLITLGAAAVVAAVMAGLNVSADAGTRTSNLVTQVSVPAAVTPVEAGPAVSSSASTPASAGPAGTLPPTSEVALPPLNTPGPEKLRVTMAGKVDDGAGTLAISIRDGQAIAYICDGDRLEAWLKGTATNGLLNLTGKNNTKITGLFDAARAAGEITVEGRAHRFEIGVVRKPSGLYRLAGQVGGAKVAGSWIVLPDGRQVGVLVRGEQPGPAPVLDITGRTTTVDGATVTGATTVDVDTGEGF